MHPGMSQDPSSILAVERKLLASGFVQPGVCAAVNKFMRTTGIFAMNDQALLSG